MFNNCWPLSFSSLALYFEVLSSIHPSLCLQLEQILLFVVVVQFCHCKMSQFLFRLKWKQFSGIPHVLSVNGIVENWVKMITTGIKFQVHITVIQQSASYTIHVVCDQPYSILHRKVSWQSALLLNMAEDRRLRSIPSHESLVFLWCIYQARNNRHTINVSFSLTISFQI